MRFSYVHTKWPSEFITWFLGLGKSKVQFLQNTWEKSSNHCIGDAHFMMIYKSVESSFTLPYFYESNYWPHSCKQHFFYWWIFFKFQFKPMQMRKKGPNLSDFKKIKSKFPEFLWWVPVGSQEYRRIFFPLLPYLVCSQIWLNYFLNDCHFDYITKSLKETLVASCNWMQNWKIMGVARFCSFRLMGENLQMLIWRQTGSKYPAWWMKV
jgi:hypothetical protein